MNFFLKLFLIISGSALIICCVDATETKHRRPLGHRPWRKPTTTKKPSSTTPTTTTEQPPLGEDPAVTRFRAFLRTDSSHPNPDYNSTIAWIKQQAKEVGLDYEKVEFPPPALFTIKVTWKGSEPNLKSVMFNSHIDVVPADPAKWKHDPFSAFKDEQGDIYARGAQDRKSLGSQYLEAARRLKAKGFKPRRTIHFTYVPDEELGGAKGMQPFLKSPEFQAMNVDVEFDEGGATPNDEYVVYYGERSTWQFKFTATGKAGHAAFMFEDNAAVKLEKVIQRLLSFRQQEMDKLKADPNLDAADVTSINLSRLGGGTQANVVPDEMWAVFDMRVRIGNNFSFNDAQKMLDDVCTEAGPGVRYEFIVKNSNSAVSAVDGNSFWWKTINNTFAEMNWKMKPKFFPAATDARHVRNAGIQSYGFSPLLFTEGLGHQDNEFINENTYLNGIEIYEAFIPKIANAV